MKREVVVSGIQFSEDGVDVQFMVIPDDVRSQGHVVMNRSAAIAYATPGPLGSSTSDLRTSVEALASLLLEQLEDLPVYEPPAEERLGYTGIEVDDDDEDDDVGMGDGR